MTTAEPDTGGQHMQWQPLSKLREWEPCCGAQHTLLVPAGCTLQHVTNADPDAVGRHMQQQV